MRVKVGPANSSGQRVLALSKFGIAVIFPLPMSKLVFLISFFASTCIWAQDSPVSVPPVVAPVEIPDDGVRVSVLGYHDFAENKPATQMRIQPSKFRKQMETIRQLGIKVISMEDFSAWKKTGKEIPKKSIVLTFDDGWKPVYTDIFPILKEFGYPFTIYLYKEYVDGGGRALTTPMIQEMMPKGATIGSHSVSHPYPVVVKNFRKKGAKRLRCLSAERVRRIQTLSGV